METENNIFAVGDVVIKTNREMYFKTVVVKVTRTQAILKSGAKLKLNGVNGCSSIGSTGFSTEMFYKSTPELEKKYVRYRMKELTTSRFEELNLMELSNEELNELYNLTTKLHNKYNK